MLLTINFFYFKKGEASMRKRNKILTNAFIIIPIICIIMIVIGIIFNNVKLAVYVILALILIAIVFKICLAIISTFRSHISK